MNKSILWGIIAVVGLAGMFYLFASKQAPKVAHTAQNYPAKQEIAKDEKSIMGVGYVMKDGKMLIEENEKFSPMTKDVMLKDRTVVTTTGQVTKEDGKTFMLTEGQSIWTDGTFMKAEAMNEDSSINSDTSALSTRYVDYSAENLVKARANNGRPVLWFAALRWCPSCQAADKDFRANFDKVPKDVTILKVDYDHDSAMKQKYGITVQDTFIQVDSQGEEIIRWNSGGQGVQALLASVK